MSTARYHEGTTPASDTVVRFDAPWGRRVGNDLKQGSCFSVGAINRRLATIRQAFPIHEGEIVTTYSAGFSAFKAARIALRSIPALYDIPAEPWIEVGVAIGRAYPLYQEKYGTAYRTTKGNVCITDREQNTLIADLDRVLSSSQTSEYIRGGASMLQQWIHLAGLVQLPDHVIETNTQTFLHPSIPEVQHVAYTGVQESNR